MKIDDQVDRMNRILMPLLGSDHLVNMWWDSRNIAFDMQTPADVWKYDRQRVFEYIRSQYNGGYS